MALGQSTATPIPRCQAIAANNMKNRIRELRAKFGLTQEELANKVGVRRETILFLEAGKYNPSLKLARDIAASFQETIESVFIFD